MMIIIGLIIYDGSHVHFWLSMIIGIISCSKASRDPGGSVTGEGADDLA